MTVAGIVVAAGRGERFGADKASAMLGGMPLWEWARQALVLGGVGDVVVVGDVPGGVAGGDRRRDSVWAGLQQVTSDVVLVHDAARPLATAALVEAVIDRIGRGDVVGVVPGLPVRDTLKRVDGDVVAATVARDGIVAAQTPQGFVTEALRRAHEASSDDATDDAELIERAGGRVAVIAGEARNIKVTFSGDLAIAEAWASR